MMREKKHRTMKSKVFLSAAMVSFMTAAPAAAHPHVFIDIAYEIRVEQGRIAGVWHQWTFSKEDSAFLVLNLDANQDGIYAEDELMPLAEENAIALADYNYYSDIVLDGEIIRPEPPLGALMRYENERLTLAFYLPLKEPVRPRESFIVDVYDPEIFIAFGTVGENPIRLSAPLEGCTLDYDKGETLQMDVFSDEFLQSLQDMSFAMQFSKKSEITCG